jgi:hypothetical protein
MTRARAIILALACVTAMSAALPVAALANVRTWASHLGPIYAGNHMHDSVYYGTITRVDGNSTGTAYTGVWVVNASDVRVSQDGYCSTPGCGAYVDWYGPYPNGYAAVENHGNASPSYFDAGVYFP